MPEQEEELEPRSEAVSPEKTPGKSAPSLWLRWLPFLLALIAVGVAFKVLLDNSASASAFPLPGAVGSAYKFTAGSPAPDFTLLTLDGKTVSLSEFRGQVVLLNFWATWCPPCRSEMPDIESLYAERKGTGFTVLAVDIQEAKEPVGKFVNQFGLTFPILMDVTGEVTKQYGVQSLPTSYFIDKAGNIASFNIGAMNRSAILKRLELAQE